jgi:hypothetical protein
MKDAPSYARISKNGTCNIAEAVGFTSGFRRACVRKKMFITSQSRLVVVASANLCGYVRACQECTRSSAIRRFVQVAGTLLLSEVATQRKEKGREGGGNRGGIPIVEETCGRVFIRRIKCVAG